MGKPRQERPRSATVRNHYRTLGIPLFASDATIRQAYIKLMKRHHFSNEGILSEDALRQIGLAYWELRHPDRRAAYDAALRATYRRRALRERATEHPMLASIPRRAWHSSTLSKWLFLLWLLLLCAAVIWAVNHRPIDVSVHMNGRFANP